MNTRMAALLRLLALASCWGPGRGYYVRKGGGSPRQELLHPRPPPFRLSSSEGRASEGLGSSLWKDVKPFYLPVKEHIDNEECEKDVKDANFYGNLDKPWARQIVDSWGKVPPGILSGQVLSPGMHEECLRVRARYNTSSLLPVAKPKLRNYTGRYCYISFRPLEEGAEGLAVPEELPPMAYGTCIPSTCTTHDMRESVNVSLREAEALLLDVACQAEGDPRPSLTPLDKVTISFLGILSVLVILATLNDVISLQIGLSAREVFLSLSLYSNLRRVLSLKGPPSAQGTLGARTITCLPALRVITMAWVIVCHQFEANVGFVQNTFDILSFQEPVAGQFVTNGWLAADTFLFLTGLLLTHRLLPHLSERRHLANASLLARGFVRRFLRLSPSILFVALFCASLLPRLSYGPRSHLLWSYSERRCRPNWWKDALFLNNYDVAGGLEDCLQNCWYTAVDMQLFLLLPVLVLPLTYHRLTGLVSLGMVSLGSVLVPLSITIAYSLPPSPLYTMTASQHRQYMTKVYLVPWCRAGPWLVGVWTALLLRSPRFARIRMYKAAVLLGYAVALCLGLGLLLGLYPYSRLPPEEEWQDSPVVSAAYGAFARPLWALCVAWVVFTCHTGNAAMVDRVLSYPGWRPMARLSLAMFLVAPVVQLWWSTVQFVPNYYNYLAKVFESAGVMVTAGLVSVLLTCLVELPLASTLDLLLPSPAKSQEVLMRRP